MNKKLVITASLLIALAIVFGAMAAHMLEKKLSPELLKTWETAARYQMYGALGLLAVGLTADRFSFKLNYFSGLLLTGIALFSGCLYLYCFKGAVPGFKTLAMIVPFGGISMIGAWTVLGIQLIRSK